MHSTESQIVDERARTDEILASSGGAIPSASGQAVSTPFHHAHPFHIMHPSPAPMSSAAMSLRPRNLLTAFEALPPMSLLSRTNPSVQLFCQGFDDERIDEYATINNKYHTYCFQKFGYLRGGWRAQNCESQAFEAVAFDQLG